jgi:hypothetical protein
VRWGVNTRNRDPNLPSTISADILVIFFLAINLAPLYKGLLTEGRAPHFRVLGTTDRRKSCHIVVPAASYSAKKATYASWIKEYEVPRADLELSVKTTT